MAKQTHLKQNLYRAQVLADFINSSDTTEFRAKNPNFFPPRIPKKWLSLILFAKRRATQIWDDETFGDLFAVAGLALLIFGEHPTDSDGNLVVKDPLPVYGFHEAVSFLHQDPWRARRCLTCKRAFVAASSKAGFCSVQCAADAKRKNKRDWWHENKETIRPKKA
jgi:hypothetical protein